MELCQPPLSGKERAIEQASYKLHHHDFLVRAVARHQPRSGTDLGNDKVESICSAVSKQREECRVVWQWTPPMLATLTLCAWE